MGPGKADLLEAIARAGSISGAARSLGMSYRRGWLLVDTMNRCFAESLVEATPGGGKGAGARLTLAGQEVLRAYRQLVSEVESAAQGEALAALRARVRTMPRAI